MIVYRSVAAHSCGLEREGLNLPTLLTLIVVGVAALGFYAWAVRRERKLRQLMPSAETRAEANRRADGSKLPPAYQTERATAEEVDVLTGGFTV